MTQHISSPAAGSGSHSFMARAPLRTTGMTETAVRTHEWKDRPIVPDGSLGERQE